MSSIPRSVETPPKLGTEPRFFGIEAKVLMVGGSIFLVGAMVGMVCESLYLMVPFGITALFMMFYRKNGLPMWSFLVRYVSYQFFEPKFRKGKNECGSALMNITDVQGSFYKVGSSTYLSMLLVGGRAFHHLTEREKMSLLGTYRNMLNSHNLDFKFQIVGAVGKIPLGKMNPAPFLDDREEHYSETEALIGHELKEHLHEIHEHTSTYYYYIVIPYRDRSDGSKKYRVQKVKRELKRRTDLIAQYLAAMGLSHRRVKGEELIETLKRFAEGT